MEYKDGQLFRIKVIKSEEDLPKKSGYLIAKFRKEFAAIVSEEYFNKDSKKAWVKEVDWYLIPEEQEPKPEITAEKIIEMAKEFIDQYPNKSNWSRSRHGTAKVMAEFAYVMMNDFTSQEPITDSDIEAWAKEKSHGLDLLTHYTKGILIDGAKAYRDNEIKHIE